MSAVLEAREPSARYLEAVPPTVVRQFDLLATAQGGVGRLRELIVLLALQGKLVEQDPQEASALDWLATIQARRDTLSAKGLVRPGKSLPPVEEWERWFDLPATWTWARLNNLVVSSEAGWSPSCPETPRRGERWGVLKVSAVSWGKFDPAANKELPDELAPRPEYEVRTGDFLLSRANTAELVARSVVVAEAPPRLMLSDKVIRLTFAEGVNRAFINLCNNSGAARNYYVAKASGTSSSMKNVSREVVLGLPIPVPPVVEQARIVARVDEMMRLCDALEVTGRLEAEQHARLLGTLLSTLTDSSTPEELAANWQRIADHFDLLLDRPEAVDALEQSILQLAVRGLLVAQERSSSCAVGSASSVTADESLFSAPQGWQWVRIGDIASVQGGIQKTPARRPVDRHVPYLRVANVQRDCLDLREIERFEVTADEVDRWGLKSGDLLVVEGNGSEHEIGRSAVWAGEIQPCVYQNHLIRVRCNEPEVVAFLQLFLNSPDGKAEMKRLAITSSGLYNLSVGKIRRFVVALPPYAEQVRIVSRVTELRRLCVDLRQRLIANQTTQSHLAEALVDSAIA